ncbi:MAG: hypothetical protein JWM68_1377 [Verrucomicrobiales bacterium]|nr:hypothetical protein [Verrucomicrobiales bacterium]
MRASDEADGVSASSLPDEKRCKNRKIKHMKNTVPQTLAALQTAAHKAAYGSGLYGAGLPLFQNTQTNINVDINALVVSILAHGTGKTELAIRREMTRTKVDISRQFLTLGRDTFKPVLGSEYNQSWDLTGLVGSLVIPRTADELLPVLTSFKGFLTVNPALEVPNKEITADKADALFEDLKDAVNAVDGQETNLGILMKARDAKAEILSKRLSDLIQELHMRMDGLDDRWKAFGFNLPGAQETPDGIGALTAVLIGPNTAALKWAAPARAEYYHVFKRVVGVDADFVLVGSPADLDFNLENLPANAHVEIVVTAVNSGGEGQRSETVTLVTH